MSWHFLQGQEEASWAGTSLDGAPSALLNLMPTPEASSSPDNATDACRDSQCGTTSEPSTASRGEDALTSCPEDSHAKTSAPLERAPESTASDPGCGVKWRELSARYDRATCGWKTHRCLWTEDLPWSSVTLPKWGMMLDGVLWERITPEPHTSETGAGCWPTPRCQMTRPVALRDGGNRGNLEEVVAERMWPTPRAGNPGSRPNGKGGKILAEEVEIAEGLRGRVFPTPCATEARQGFQDRSRGKKGSQESLSTVIQGAPAREAGGSLNPNWVEWLMGWPLGWTSTEPMPELTWAAWQRAFRSEPIASVASGMGRFRLPL